jgi:molybdenum cofactor cytidylyltransferase
MVASSFGAVIGAPCLFPRWCFGELAALQDDQGARRVSARHAMRVLAVDHPEAGIDMDTPQQLAER